MKTAFLFPGQGAQFVGMGKDICEKYKEANEVYEKSGKILGVDVKKLCFEGDGEELNKTKNTQIAIAVTSLAILEVLKSNGVEADISVGLSLGEYVALIYAGIIEMEEGLLLLKKRGTYMQDFVPKGNYEMAAVIGLDCSKIQEIVQEVKKSGKFVALANFNYSEQTVISGEIEGIEEAVEKLKIAGAKKVVKLKTSGPFHTEKLEKAKELFSQELKKIKFKCSKNDIKVIKNIDGTYYTKQDDIKEILSKHIVSPVRFDKAIQKMKDEQVKRFIEIGPGKALSGFVKKELKGEEIEVINICDVNSLENFLYLKDETERKNENG